MKAPVSCIARWSSCVLCLFVMCFVVLGVRCGVLFHGLRCVVLCCVELRWCCVTCYCVQCVLSTVLCCVLFCVSALCCAV